MIFNHVSIGVSDVARAVKFCATAISLGGTCEGQPGFRVEPIRLHSFEIRMETKLKRSLSRFSTDSIGVCIRNRY